MKKKKCEFTQLRHNLRGKERSQLEVPMVVKN